MSLGFGRTNTKDVKQLSENIVKLCGKISVAKKETSQLATLCETLSNCSISSQQSNYDDIKSNLVNVEKKLTDWSKLSLPRSLMKRAQIETGIAEIIGGLEVISQAIQPARTSSPINQGAREGLTTSVPGTGHDKFQSHESLLSHATEPEINDIEVNEAPPVKRLDGEVTREGQEDLPFSGGTYCEVWIGRWEKRSGEKVEVEKVALKAIRTTVPREMARTRLESELRGWAELRHINILPFYGIVTNIGQRVYMVSPWHENGNLLVYVKNTPQPNKNHLLCGSASGLSYLHSRGVVHGSVKCNNVFVSREGEPQLCDFGIAGISGEINVNSVSKTVSSGGFVRYSAPELIETADIPATMQSDTYSFALLILECIAEEAPFSNLVRDAAVIHARIGKKQIPPRPDGGDRKNRVSDDLWDLMKRCWETRPDQRPTMEKVHSFFLHHA